MREFEVARITSFKLGYRLLRLGVCRPPLVAQGLRVRLFAAVFLEVFLAGSPSTHQVRGGEGVRGKGPVAVCGARKTAARICGLSSNLNLKDPNSRLQVLGPVSSTGSVIESCTLTAFDVILEACCREACAPSWALKYLQVYKSNKLYTKRSLSPKPPAPLAKMTKTLNPKPQVSKHHS